MTDDRRERFIEGQIEGLRALGLNDAALAREEAMLRTGFAQNDLLFRLLPTPLAEGAKPARQIPERGDP